MKKIAVTGAAGQIAYSLIFDLARGGLYGDEPIVLHLIDVEGCLKSLEGVVMELEDGAFSRLQGVKIGSSPQELFAECDFAFLVGAKPRGPGMERVDLLKDNATIFLDQGRALQEVAKDSLRVLVVGNPCNSNAWVLSRAAPRIPKRQIHAMTRLDQHRACAMLAKKMQVPVGEVTDVTIWGNHSGTQVPDFTRAKVGQRPILDHLDRVWLEGEFMASVQNRGSSVIAARGKSSAASAAHAALVAAYDIVHSSPMGYNYSSATYSGPNPYGIDPDLYYSFPCRTDSAQQVQLVEVQALDPWLLKKMKLSEKELIEEKDQLCSYLKNL